MYEEGDVEPTITVECSGQRASVKLRGDLDLQVDDELTRTISVAASEPGIAETHVDALTVTFINSSGLRALLVSRHVALDRGLAYSIRIASAGSDHPAHRDHRPRGGPGGRPRTGGSLNER
jgi:anti-anti-sigma factor